MTFRLIGQLIVSSLLTLVSVLATGFLLAIVGKEIPVIREILNLVTRLVPDEVLIVMLALFFFILYMVLFNIRRYWYLASMLGAIRRIADGNFEEKLPIKQRNELGDLAEYINYLVMRLKTSLDEERNAEQTKNELITNVSHDLRTPLTSILGYLGLADGDRYRDEVELRHYVSIAYEKSKRLHVLINDLFEYTRMRHAKLPVKFCPLDLGELLNQLLVQSRLQLQEAGIEASFQQKEGNLMVNGDPNKLVRVFENLFSNAITYGRDGKRMEISAYRDGTAVVVDVTNYGEPIPSADLPYIFDRFYRVDKSRGDDSGGSGLGLAITKNIVELHGGVVSAESDWSRTCFSIRLPWAGGGA